MAKHKEEKREGERREEGRERGGRERERERERREEKRATPSTRSLGKDNERKEQGGAAASNYATAPVNWNSSKEEEISITMQARAVTKQEKEERGKRKEKKGITSTHSPFVCAPFQGSLCRLCIFALVRTPSRISIQDMHGSVSSERREWSVAPSSASFPLQAHTQC